MPYLDKQRLRKSNKFSASWQCIRSHLYNPSGRSDECYTSTPAFPHCSNHHNTLAPDRCGIDAMPAGAVCLENHQTETGAKVPRPSPGMFAHSLHRTIAVFVDGLFVVTVWALLSFRLHRHDHCLSFVSALVVEFSYFKYILYTGVIASNPPFKSNNIVSKIRLKVCADT